MSTQKRGKGAPRAPSGPRHERSQLRREQLLASALTLFARHGYAGTSTKKIAEAAGITEGLVFHYFPTKLDLLRALGSRRHSFAGRLLVRLEQFEGSARALLAEIGAGLTLVSREEAEFISVMIAESQTHPELGEAIIGTTGVGIERIVERLRGYVAQGELRDDVDLEVALHGFLGGFLFFAVQYRHRPGGGSAPSAAAFAAQWAELCWRGMASPASLSKHSKTKGTPS